MKKPGLLFLFIFIFLTGLFSGLFFSTHLSEENNAYLSALLLSGFSGTGGSFPESFFSSLTANLTLAALMLPALFTKYLCPLPPAVLWYKSFAIGFCSGLIYINAPQQAILLSLLKILPQNLFLIPAFLLLAALLFSASLAGKPALSGRAYHQKSRAFQWKRLLLYGLAIAAVLILLGALMEAVFHLIALSPS